ncbi:MAG: general secretion pathway protein GspB, partial [Xanthomonadales bacterium]|nr:general secretion pathway protein GspB [Xanthomonadales bacterium]
GQAGNRTAESGAEEGGNPANEQATRPRTPVERLSQAQAAAQEPSDPPAASTAVDRIATYSGEEDVIGDEAGEFDDAGLDDTVSVEQGEALVEESIGAEDPDDDIVSRVDEAAIAMAREQPPDSDVRSYWQLPQSWRSEMPEFRITVMVYAEEPEDRFLLMNGVRLREGEDHEGVRLEEIRRDGAVFRYNRTEFFVKN